MGNRKRKKQKSCQISKALMNISGLNIWPDNLVNVELDVIKHSLVFSLQIGIEAKHIRLPTSATQEEVRGRPCWWPQRWGGGDDFLLPCRFCRTSWRSTRTRRSTAWLSSCLLTPPTRWTPSSSPTPCPPTRTWTGRFWPGSDLTHLQLHWTFSHWPRPPCDPPITRGFRLIG